MHKDYDNEALLSAGCSCHAADRRLYAAVCAEDPHDRQALINEAMCQIGALALTLGYRLVPLETINQEAA